MFDLVALIKVAGYLGISAIIFAESGLLVGFFLPGDSLLFTAGVLASQGYLNIGILLGISFIAAVVGDSVGYWFGHRFGPKVFKRENSLFFHKEHVERARSFYQNHGGKTIIIARFLPIVRTLAPIMAGVGKMPYRLFVVYNVVGGLLWAVGLPLLGWYIGGLFPNLDHYILLIVPLIIFVSVLPSLAAIARNRYKKKLRSINESSSS